MQKGDRRKKEILDTAEKLFCQRGYNETSVQDILNVLELSKGSFYHHYESKDQVLESICERRAETSAVKTAEEVLTKPEGSLERLNAALRGMIPLRKSEAEFLSVLLPQMFTRTGRSLCVAYQDAITAAMLPMLETELSAARAAGLICPPGHQSCAPVLCAVMNQCWLKAAELMLHNINTPQAAEPAELLDELDRCRCAVERLLDAPFGSLELLPLEEWLETRLAIAQRVGKVNG